MACRWRPFSVRDTTLRWLSFRSAVSDRLIEWLPQTTLICLYEKTNEPIHDNGNNGMSTSPVCNIACFIDYGITTSYAVQKHYNDVIMGAMASQITSLAYSIVCIGGDQRKHQSSASLAFVRGIHRWPVNSPRKWPVTRKIFPFDDGIIILVSINSDLLPAPKKFNGLHISTILQEMLQVEIYQTCSSIINLDW